MGVINQVCQTLFKFNPTPKQELIIKTISLLEHRWVCINAYTRYGKTRCAAIGICLYILTNDNKKIAIIAPTNDQASILRNYIAEEIIGCPELSNLIELERDMTIERLKKEVSRNRWTFKNNCELRILSAEGEASRLLGFGANIVVIDESSKISREAYSKIVRMLGDDPENSILIELSNPWSRDCKYYDHYVDDKFFKIHIPYEVGIEEGRTTQLHIDDMRKEMTETEFQVLYLSNFPDESEDSLLRLSWINQAINKDLKIKDGKRIVSCDPAGQGTDKTIVMWGTENNGMYKVEGIYSENYTENQVLAKKIVDLVIEQKAEIINVDCIGLGEGIVSRLKEVFKNKPVKINACHFGESPEEVSIELAKLPTSHKKRFLNKKAEQYFRLRSLLEEGLISIPENVTLKKELLSIKWEKTLSEKIKIVDPEEGHTDFACALVYFVWKANKEVGFFFG